MFPLSINVYLLFSDADENEEPGGASFFHSHSNPWVLVLCLKMCQSIHALL
jgi:hypothetical protein